MKTIDIAQILSPDMKAIILSEAKNLKSKRLVISLEQKDEKASEQSVKGKQLYIWMLHSF